MNSQTAYLAIDIGTTHSKAALFLTDGTLLQSASCRTASVQEKDQVRFDPERMWDDIASLIRQLTAEALGYSIAGIGIASMAESGLLVGRRTGKAKSPFLPWFSTVTAPQIERIQMESDPVERFIATGLKPSFKFGLAKLLWLREHVPDSFAEDDPVWLSSSDYIASKLTGEYATDQTLAARTYAYRLDTRSWDADWLREFGFRPELFPDALPAGAPIGKVTADNARSLGLPGGTPVVIAGHDHVAAALASGVVHPDAAMNSIGTAETYVGMMEQRPLTAKDYETGFSYGPFALPGTMFWMGSVPASGGSVEWMRTVIADTSLSYEEMDKLLTAQEQAPTGIMYYPNLSGKGAFVGLHSQHGKGHLLKAVLEGTAYEMELIRQAAQVMAGRAPEVVTVVGGGVKNRHWLQIKADISGIPLHVPQQCESTLLGAAILTAAGTGAFPSIEAARSAMTTNLSMDTWTPDASRHCHYSQLLIEKYKPLQTYIHQFV